MPNNCLPVLYKYIIQVENKNMGLKGGGGGGAQTYHCPPPPPRIKKVYASVLYISHRGIFFVSIAVAQNRVEGSEGGGGVCHCNCFQYVQV